MKIAIVQGACGYTGEMKQVVTSLRQTVRAWAERNGYDYHFFKEFNVPDMVVSNYDYKDTQDRIGVFRYWWLHSIAQNYDLICWIDADVEVIGNPDVFSLGRLDKFNIATRRKAYEFGEFIFEIPNSWFSYTDPKSLNHFIHWLETVLTDKKAQSNEYITLKTCLKVLNDEELIALYNKEFDGICNFIDLPCEGLQNPCNDEYELINSIHKNNVLVHHNYPSDRLRAYKISRTYQLYLKYLYLTKKHDSKIRHTIVNFSNQQLDEFYNLTVNKLKRIK